MRIRHPSFLFRNTIVSFSGKFITSRLFWGMTILAGSRKRVAG